MGMIRYIREEFQVITERDPAIKSPMEVLLYPSFRAIAEDGAQDGDRDSSGS